MAILGGLGAILFVVAVVWLIYSIVKHQGKKMPLIMMVAAAFLFIVAAVATPAPLDGKLSNLVDAETSMRANLMDKDYDNQLYASEYAKLEKTYKKATGETIPSGPSQYLDGSAEKRRNNGSVGSGQLYVGAFKYMNTHAAEKVAPDKVSDTVKQMHDQYLNN